LFFGLLKLFKGIICPLSDGFENGFKRLNTYVTFACTHANILTTASGNTISFGEYALPKGGMLLGRKCAMQGSNL
jgi:hypothetical protein